MFLLDDQILLHLLKEDVPYGDQTTRSLGFGKKRGRIIFRARDPMLVCGSEEAARLFELVGCEVDLACASGEQREPGALILAAAGPAEALFAAWKVAQTLTEWASGVASAASRVVRAARAVNPGIVVACTRKTVPGTRALSLKAITAGGAAIHRSGLSDTVLLFPEHRAFGGEPDRLRSLQWQIATVRDACPERAVVVEVTSPEDAMHAAECGANVVQLEKFTPAAVAAVVAALGPASAALVAAAGGITAGNAAAYAGSGASILVTSAPYSAPPADISVVLEPDGGGASP